MTLFTQCKDKSINTSHIPPQPSSTIGPSLPRSDPELPSRPILEAAQATTIKSQCSSSPFPFSPSSSPSLTPRHSRTPSPKPTAISKSALAFLTAASATPRTAPDSTAGTAPP
ncbi:unnamed protein product [Tuber melanosporum]|uniref:(Perigord truffle) hypothetical protein n=1 Tax=Tuber melanosporum (strain Mel28) TaxID=656061 RepID=D5GES5_TUBMM|nr:uncharacterized protein GSTUM_00006593001 [Tuber melanosporum]CAZ83018.1 unnamed protein product [Tuber melanosporum]